MSFTATFRGCAIVDLPAAAGADLCRMPHIHRLLMENVLRSSEEAESARKALLDWLETGSSEAEIPFLPGRVLMHDTTCGPALVDIAAMRSALAEAGHDPALLNPVLPVDVSTDHSLAVDAYAIPSAMARNIENEYRRNAERYRFMKWATNSLSNFRVHPPGTGIMHTLNLERLATVVAERDGWIMPDTLIGTDSHTPMINGIGVLAWGVGGIEAESVFFGMPVMLRVPDVVGVRFKGRLREGVTATDLALTVTERLRQIDLADRFVEFFGPGVSTLSAGDRAVVANMTPEFGGNSGFFPVDAATIAYLRQTGRSTEHCALVEDYCRRQGLWFDPEQEPVFTGLVELDLGEVEVSVAGPRRPQDRIPASDTASATAAIRGHAPLPAPAGKSPDGAVAIAAITSCTNTSDPRLLVAAGLVARKARALGLKPPAHVKTSMAPGSPTSQRYLDRAGLLSDLEAVGFGIVGYGCTTCIGNSGPLPDSAIEAQAEGRLQVAVLSGNRNFPGRVHPQLEAGFLASPPLVVAFALAGDVERDILHDEIAPGVHLSDLWPKGEEIDTALALARNAGDFAAAYDRAEASELWRDLDAPDTALFPWDPASTYIRRPPFADFAKPRAQWIMAAPILVVGDDITTDHISPAGAIPRKGEAADYLIAGGDPADDLNVFSSRRGNWEAMRRGLFTNKSVRNLLVDDIPPGSTMMPDGSVLPLWRAAEYYRCAGVPVVILAGERYGMGSSRDWAAKGAALLGTRAVLAVSFERIHRSNLIGMGILPLRLPVGVTPQTLAMSVCDRIEIDLNPARLAPRVPVEIRIHRSSGTVERFEAIAAIETSLEVETLAKGGLMPLILERVIRRRTEKKLPTAQHES
ncbi:aconitate hydratase AcnA [Paracoccus sp. PAR01]|uniref:aconitate hydratase AcnA n=1 Tax=Paracoccus sp. PAR01 TaxID=2769282 RepID=UPI001783D1AE|nr:aconitate hydratase AcnA [Paracoccus sp. PAR01]MBD9529800.1 aconitate hydratase AcnA [Paracoccus sp. PAR01]